MGALGERSREMQALEVRNCQFTQLMELQVNSEVGQGGYVSEHQSGPLQ